MVGVRSCGAAIAALFLLGGCVHAPALEVASQGQPPAGAGASYGFGHDDAGEGEALRARIAACLDRRGMKASGSPRYLVQVGLSDRPARSSVLIGDAGSQPPPKGAAARRASRSLAVSLTEMASGREVYRVQVTDRYRRAAARRPLSDLGDAACAALAGGGAPAAH